MNTAILSKDEQQTCREMTQTPWEIVSRLTDEVAKLREENDALKAAAGRVLIATGSMELEYAYEALYKAVNSEAV